MSVLFFCVGAAKCGTSWLHRQLADHPDCHFRAIKELHYFNALEAGKLPRELAKHREYQKAMLQRFGAGGERPNDEQAARMRDRADWMDVLESGGDLSAYRRYLETGAGDARVVGEMTPAYALLPETRLAEMARISDDVRFLYVMRDPVERLWSHIRMIAARRDPKGEVRAKRCARIFDRVIAGDEPQIARRSDYATAIARLISAVPSGKVLFDVFENMIDGNGLARLCQFLGIANVTPNRVPVHAGQALEMSAVQRHAAAAFLAPQYDAAARALGGRPDAWAMKG